ncbi:hypothetical protein IV102_32015 [bacterium]|nr:hypothetical protein [bacterium]
MRKWRSLFTRLVLGLMLTSMANAVPAVTFAELTGNVLAGPALTAGWQFTTNSAVTVTDLGFFDDSQNGLAQAHDVGIFSAAGALLVSAIVPAGVGAPLINQFRYSPVAPTLLGAGLTFRIGAFYAAGSPELIRTGATGFATDPAITFVGGRIFLGPALADPTGVFAGNSIFGPNFNFVAAAAGAPESDGRSSGAAVASIWVMLALLQRRRRTSPTC